KDVSAISQLDEKKILVSNSLKEFILPVLKHLNLRKMFKEIYSADDFDDKTDFIKQYLKERNLDARKVVYIGDRVADVKVAKVVGCISIIIAGKCAWDSLGDILKEKPDFLIDDLSSLKQILR
ncbi:MAG: HAD family hydrolase, partial [Candidatus Nanoarchaeia archaeon]